MSKFASKLEMLISDAEDKVLDRDTSVLSREWALSWLKASNAIEMLQNDAIRTNFPEGVFLPEPLEADAREILDKMSKTAFPAAKELSETIEAIGTMLAVCLTGDLEDDPDITDELIQKGLNVGIAYNAGKGANEHAYVPKASKRAEASNSDILRNLGRLVTIDIKWTDGTNQRIRRNGNANNAFHSIRTEALKRGFDYESDILPQLREWNKLLVEACKGQTSLNEDFTDISGNQLILSF